MINILPRLNKGYYTQIVTDIPIEERIFANEMMGVRATMDNFRLATPEEVEAWEEWKMQEEENNPLN